MLIEDGLELLDEEECHALLAAGTIGRVGTTIGALPVILPVNYAYVDGAVVFRTGDGTKLRASKGGSVIAFEVDAYDAVARRGWSVLVVGRADVVTDDGDLERLRSLGLAPWANGERTTYVRLHPEMLTGRRIVGH
jgi:nitroimidazol reductase NimA-like FMN-containing flavoprotein (pyridoxamine 5'-phosphate oxidase superfamily)